MNIELQAALNPAGDRKVERFGWTFAPGDKVMQIENDYDKEVYNGDIGYIDDVDPNAGEIVASFDGRSVTYGFGELDMLVPAYAATIHKSQGSEYPAVIIPVLTQHYPMLQRNLLYTGVTRGKRLVVLVGQKKAVAIAVRNVSGRRRWSKLSEWLESKTSMSTDHRKLRTMNSSKAHKIWIEQCEATHTIRARFGLKAAFDYIVGEKLINFADAASRHRDFAQELPRFISEVRRMFTPEEIGAQLTRIEREQNQEEEDVLDEDDPLGEDPASIAERARQFMTIKELLTATTLGTS